MQPCSLNFAKVVTKTSTSQTKTKIFTKKFHPLSQANFIKFHPQLFARNAAQSADLRTATKTNSTAEKAT
jgi:hypothetical protein